MTSCCLQSTPYKQGCGQSRHIENTCIPASQSVKDIQTIVKPNKKRNTVVSLPRNMHISHLILLLIVAWKLFWWVLYGLFGVHLGYITINNGFSFNSIEWSTRRFRITARSVRLRLWGNSKKCIITNLDVVLHNHHSKKERHSSTSESPSSLSIYPKNWAGKLLFRWVAKMFPTIDLDVRTLTLNHQKATLDIDSFRVQVEKRNTTHEKSAYYYSCLLAIKQLEGVASVSTTRLPFSLGQFSVSTSLSIQTKTGQLGDISCQVHLDSSKVDVFGLIKSLLSSSPRKKQHHHSISDIEGQLESLTNFHNEFFTSFSEFSITVANSEVDGIPLFSASDECSMTEFLEKDKPDSSLRLSVNSVSCNLARVEGNAAGFDVLFDNSNDHPFELTSSASLLKLSFVTRRFHHESESTVTDVDEFFNFPNCTFTFKSNVTDNLARGNGFKNCVMELFSTGSSPMLDVDVDQFALLAYNYVVVKKIMKLRKIKQSQPEAFTTHSDPELSGSETDDDTRIADSTPGTPDTRQPEGKVTRFAQIIDRSVALLNEFYPKIDFKFTVEQPRAVLRNRIDKTTQILMLSFATFSFHALSTELDDYVGKIHFLHPCMTFSERYETANGNRHYQEEFFGLSHMRSKIEVMKNLKFKVALGVSGGFISLAKPDVLNGINSLIKICTKVVNHQMKNGLINIHYDAEIVRERDFNPLRSRNRKKNMEDITMDSVFSALPDWFVELELHASNMNVKLGSASPLLPPDLISKLSESKDRRVNDTKNALNFSIDEFKWNLSSANANETSSTPSNASSDTLSGEKSKQTFWKVLTSARDVSLCLIENGNKSSPVLNFPSIYSSLSAAIVDNKPKVILDFDIDEISGLIDRHRIFAMIGSIYLLKVTIIEPLQILKEKIKRSTATLRSQEDERKEASMQQYLLFDFSVQRFNYVAALSNDFKIRLQLYSFATEISQGVINVTNGFARLLADSPIINGYWNRMICLDSLNVKINDPSESHKIVFYTPSLRIIQPHRFVVYKLFDNLGVFIKVAKHLVMLLKSEKKNDIVFPKESPPLKIPHMRVRAAKLMYTVEDDPFEADLNMIYQLGLVEQRKRLEIMDLFEERCSNVNFEDDDYQEKLTIAQKTIETSWIRKVKVYKSKLAEEIINNKEFLFGAELKIPEGENQRVSAYYKHAPLLRTVMTGFDLDLSSPHFSLEKLPDFIYDYGQKVPKDTRYNMIIPTHVNLTLDEMRMHMRDYPLPLLYLPKSNDQKGKGKALVMKGHLIISEALVQDKEHLRRLEVPLSNVSDNTGSKNTYDKLVIEKSMSTVKLYTNLDILFDSKAAARFVWGQSYQFAIQQIMLNWDQFSKPPVDPSRKLGFWDKMRLVLHGKCKMKTGKHSSIEVAIKGGRDPYDLFNTSSGFVLAFEDHVQWNTNEDENSLNFFNISSRKVSWYIPNYMNGPLVCWCRESSKPTLFSANDKMITSCHAYYLDGLQVSPADMINMDTSVMEKGVVELSGGVNFVVGFLLQRLVSDDEVTEKGKPHWEIELCNPEYTKEGHDSYKGFRSDRLHMAISLVANSESSYNTIHLSRGAFNQFFAWWTLFHGNMMLPVRKGKIFSEAKETTKFSEHLYTIKYLFNLKNLFLSHIQTGQELDDSEEFSESVGLRAKIDSFLVDLHQRKEPRIDEHEDLSRQKKILKMNFNRGEVSLTKIDLRTILTKFKKNLYNSNDSGFDEKCKFTIFDNDYQWFDSHDFDDAFAPTSKGVKTKVEVLPLMYSEKFSYIRDTSSNSEDVDWGHEKTHDCTLNQTDIFSTQIGIFRKRLADLEDGLHRSETNKTESSVISQRIDTLNKNIKISESQRKRLGRKDSIATVSTYREHFQNRFVLISMFLKWNEKVRNLFMKYIHFVQLNGNLKKYLSYDFMSMLEKLVRNNDTRDDDLSSLNSSVSGTHRSLEQLKGQLNKFQSSQERLDNFDEIIRSVNESEMFKEDFKVEIVSPQIQLGSEMEKNSVVLITAPILEAKILSIINKENNLSVSPKELEDRYGFLLHDACVMVLDKQGLQYRDALLEKHPYGTTSNWPPFLGIEVCKDNTLAPAKDILIERMSLMITYDQVKASGSKIDQIEGNPDTSSRVDDEENGDDNVNRFRVDCPDLTIHCTSKQYFTLYVTSLSLLLYSEPMSVHLRDKLSKLKFSINFQDFSAMHGHLLGLRRYLEGTRKVLNNYNFRQTSNMDNETLNEYLLLHSEEQNISTEIVLILQTLFSGDVFTDSSAQAMEEWRIAADCIVLHMLTDKREPILDLKIDRGVCKRIIKEDGSNDNRIEIKNIEGINKLKNAYYDKFLETISPKDEDSIAVQWSMNRPVGGIRIMESFEISSEPLDVKIDEETGRSLMKFIFHTEEDNGSLVDVSAMKEVEEAVRERDEIDGNVDESEHEDRSDSDKDSNKEGLENSELDVPRQGRSKGDNSSHSREVHFRNRSQSSSGRHLGKKASTKNLSLNSGSDTTTDFDDNVTEMLQRSKQYLTIVSMTCHSFQLMISLRMKKGFMRWLNVTNFKISLPEWTIERQVTSMLDIAKIFKKMIISALLSHSTSLIKNKLSSRATNARQSLTRKS